MLLAVDWRAALIFGGIWMLIAAIFRYSSLSALIACLATPFVLFSFDKLEAALLFIVLTVLVWIKHRAKIARLFEGAEPKIGAPK